MEKQQAIEVLKPLVNSFVDYANITMKEEDDDIAEALEIAVDALKAQLFREGTTKGATYDLISRQEAIDAVMEYGAIWMEYTDAMDKGEIAQRALNNAKSTMIRILKELPSVQPEPKEGHRILRETPDGGEQYECSECGVLWEFNDGSPEDNEAYFCPKCGARMKGERT